MEVKMPYIRQLGSGFIIIEVVLGGSFLILLGDLKLAIILGTIFAVGITIMAVTEQIIYHRYKIPPIKELVEKEHQIIVYGAGSIWIVREEYFSCWMKECIFVNGEKKIHMK